MYSARARLLQTESFRLAAIYAGIFLLSTLLLMTMVFAAVDRAFESGQLRAANDDLAAIRRAYAAGFPRGKALHEAKEMIDDRLLASDAADLFLLLSGPRRVAGNLPAMRARTGEQRFPLSPGDRDPARSDHIVLGSGAFLGGQDYAFVGRDLQSARQAEERVLETFAIFLVASFLIALAGGMLLSRSFLHRIDAITTTCRAIMAGHMDERIPVRHSRNELDQLGSTINDMLDRIAALLDSLRQVSNDIAHDLRTPLAHLRYRLERAQHNSRSAGEYEVAVNEAVADCDHILGLFASLLRIAQIESGARRTGMSELDLSDLLHEVAALYEPTISDDGRPFVVNIAPGLFALGDRQLLYRLLANLLDNAIRHTSKASAIALDARRVPGRIQVVVSDRGSGIPPEDREAVFRRFYRRDQSRTTPGSGLGLALASAIADLHGTKIVLSDNDPGLRATIELEELPAAQSGACARAEPSLSVRKDNSRNDHQTYSET
jgi:signal transduction histidine kinase